MNVSFELSRRIRSPLGAVGILVAVVIATPAPAQADRFMANYITNWSSCDATCQGSAPLSYTDDQANYFAAKMTSLGHTQAYYWGNNNVYATDIIEDKDFLGQDHWFADDVDVYFYSGHGASWDNAWGQSYFVPMCHSANVTNSCELDIERARLGERSGAYIYPNNGDARWLILCTCFSVDTKPNEQWNQTLWYGLDAVMGYRGLSADSYTTDEVGEDFADAAWGDNDTLKSAWFWAIEDTWVDDTGSLVVPNRASTGNEANAAWVRDNIRHSWARRSATWVATGISWSWHEG